MIHPPQRLFDRVSRMDTVGGWGFAELGKLNRIGYGSDSEHDRGVTTSGINTSNITITDAAGQNASGISVEQIKAQVKTDTTTDTVQANSGAIANNFDKDAVQKEIGLQVSVTQQFDTTRQGVKAEINKQIDGLQAELKTAKTLEEKDAIEQKINSWQNAGTLTDMIAGGLYAPTSSALGIAAATAAPAVQYQIGQIFKDNQAKNELDKLMTGTSGTRPEEGSALHVLAHTVLAAAVAAAGGNDALTAGLSVGGAEALAPKVANWLFGNTAGIEKDENGNVIASKLTAEQKQTVSNIVSLGAAGLTAGADVVQGAQLAGSAVEDNVLGAQNVGRYLQTALDSHANPNLDMRERIQAVVNDSAYNDKRLSEIAAKLDKYHVDGVNTLTADDYVFLKRVERNIGGKKGMENTFHAVEQATKVLVAQGKLSPDDRDRFIRQMYQLNMANPMINKIDGILADAKVAQRNPAGFTPKVEQPLVVQSQCNSVACASDVAGIDVPTSTKTITFTGNATAIAGEAGRTGGAGIYITLPGNRTVDSVDSGLLITGGRGAGLDIGVNAQLGVTKGNKDALRGESTSIGVGAGPVGASVGLDKDNNVNSAAVSVGRGPIPVSGTVTNTTTCTSGVSDWINLEAGACK